MPKKDSPKEAAQIHIARISAKQAVIVACITALAGLIGSLISYSQGVRHSPSRHYLKIVRVEKRGFPNLNPSVRIVADINGQTYSYPSKAVWADIGQETPGESFPLPPDQTDYTLRFSAFYRKDAGAILQLTSSDAVSISASELPTVNTFNVYLLDEGFTRGGPDGLVIYYEIR